MGKFYGATYGRYNLGERPGLSLFSMYGTAPRSAVWSLTGLYGPTNSDCGQVLCFLFDLSPRVHPHHGPRFRCVWGQRLQPVPPVGSAYAWTALRSKCIDSAVSTLQGRSWRIPRGSQGPSIGPIWTLTGNPLLGHISHLNHRV